MVVDLEEKLHLIYEWMEHSGDILRYEPNSQETQKFLRLPFNINFEDSGRYKDVVVYIRTLEFEDEEEEDEGNDFVPVDLKTLLEGYCETKDGFLIPEWVAKDANLFYRTITVPETAKAEVSAYVVSARGPI